MAMRIPAVMLPAAAAVGTRGLSVPTRPGVAGRIRVTMPIYEYRCDNDHRFEVLQRFSDDAIEVCEVCGAPARRVLHPVAIHFKGSGFYSTDYCRGKKAGGSDGEGEAGGAAGPTAGGSKHGARKKAGGSG